MSKRFKKCKECGIPFKPMDDPDREVCLKCKYQKK